MALVAVGLVGCPPYSVWYAHMAGEAELAQANQNRQVAVAQSRAKAEAAHYEAEAEVARAQGVAQANTIIGNSLKGNEAYLRYLWIDRLDSTKGQIIYVPTEAGLPILEAGRLPEKQP
jgi:regulator of protease activity HflC (stomatin/prohibitin superfamily)